MSLNYFLFVGGYFEKYVYGSHTLNPKPRLGLRALTPGSLVGSCLGVGSRDVGFRI